MALQVVESSQTQSSEFGRVNRNDTARTSQNVAYKMRQDSGFPSEHRNSPISSRPLVLSSRPIKPCFSQPHIIYIIPNFDMIPKILRTLKAALVRRKPSKSSGWPAAPPPLCAGPDCTTLLFAPRTPPLPRSPRGSDAMLATVHLTEIVALFPDDDGSDYDGDAVST